MRYRNSTTIRVNHVDIIYAKAGSNDQLKICIKEIAPSFQTVTTDNKINFTSFLFRIQNKKKQNSRVFIAWNMKKQ